jgi:murein DD-endopeptidase MepM/ murein hydrolase activator NlpD
MKLYHDYKKRFKIWVIIFIGLLLISPIAFSYAQTVTDLNQKISQKNSDITQLEQEIQGYQIQLDSLSKQKDSLNTSLQELDINRKKLSADISVTQNKIDQTNLKIEELSLDINNKQDQISNNIDSLTLSIKQINEIDQNDILPTLLSQNNFTDVWNDVDDIAKVNDKIKEEDDSLQEVKSNLENTKEQTTQAKNDLTALKSKLSDQKKIVDQNTVEKNKLLAQTKDSESNYQKLLKDRLAKKAAFEKELNDYESQLKYVLNPSSLPTSGVLSWPLDYIYVTQFFGKTEAGKRLYANGTHNGVDFRASIGTPVKAMADGVVAGTGDTDLQCPKVSFGRFILIKYNNGLASTFGHLSLIKVSTGETVTRGQVVGYSGSTGYATGPHLHVSVYARDAVNLKTLPSISCPGRVLTQPISPINAYLDPMYYLPPYSQ